MARDRPARRHQDRLDGLALQQRSETAGVKSSTREERAPHSARLAAQHQARWLRVGIGYPEPRMAGARVVVQRVTEQPRAVAPRTVAGAQEDCGGFFALRGPCDARVRLPGLRR
jgi:hypothetical protein